MNTIKEKFYKSVKNKKKKKKKIFFLIDPCPRHVLKIINVLYKNL